MKRLNPEEPQQAFDRAEVKKLHDDIAELYKKIVNDPNIRYKFVQDQVELPEMPLEKKEPVLLEPGFLASIYWTLLASIPVEKVKVVVKDREQSMEEKRLAYEQERVDYKKYLRALKQTKFRLDAIFKMVSELVGFKKTMSKEPVLIKVTQVAAEFIVPAVVSFSVGELGDMQGDVWALPDKNAFSEHSLQKKKVPQIVISFNDHRTEIGSARITITYYGPELGEGLTSGTAIYSGQLIENSQISLDDGTVVPFYAATTGQIVAGIADKIKEGAQNRIQVSPAQISAIFDQLIGLSTHVAKEIEAIYENSLLNERFAAAIASHSGHTILRLYFTKLFADTNPQMELLLHGLESGKLRTYYDFRVALYALASGNVELVNEVVVGRLPARNMLQQLLESGVLNALGKYQLSEQNSDQKALAQVNQQGAELMQSFGYTNITKYDPINARQLAVVLDIHILLGLFEDSSLLAQRLQEYGKGITDIFVGYIEVGIEKHKYELNTLQLIKKRLEENRATVTNRIANEAYVRITRDLEQKISHLMSNPPEMGAKPGEDTAHDSEDK